MLDEASLHLARCLHGARISVEISHCNLAAIRQNEQNDAHGLAHRQALIINTRVVACQKPSRSTTIFFTLEACVFSKENKRRGTGPAEGKDARMLSVHLSSLNLAT